VSSKNSDGIFSLQSYIEEKSQEIISFELQKHISNINIILFGPFFVGKYSLIERIINNSFNLMCRSCSGKDVETIKKVKVDLKNHSSIIYKYIILNEEESYISEKISFLENADIIIFLNSNDKLKVNTSKIEERVSLSDKKIIYCINKKDLLSDGETNETLKKFKILNNKLKDNPILLVSAKTSYGIQELKNKIEEYSINIIEKKNKFERQNSFFSTKSVNTNNTNFDLEPDNNKNKEKCCNYL
jgi:tRNA U34 5-carboxymethylaminomethyl modifying GTPase MnmE/TrmE